MSMKLVTHYNRIFKKDFLPQARFRQLLILRHIWPLLFAGLFLVYSSELFVRQICKQKSIFALINVIFKMSKMSYFCWNVSKSYCWRIWSGSERGATDKPSISANWERYSRSCAKMVVINCKLIIVILFYDKTETRIAYHFITISFHRLQFFF